MNTSNPSSIVEAVANEAIPNLSSGFNSEHLSLETIALLVNTERLKFLERKITNEFIELKERQEQVSSLNKLIKAINHATIKDELDCTNDDELKAMLKHAQELGVTISEDKLKYNKTERERLIDNIRLTIGDLNVLNDMQLQTVNRLTTERYESYQLARSIMKPLHDDKINKARAASGRG